MLGQTLDIVKNWINSIVTCYRGRSTALRFTTLLDTGSPLTTLPDTRSLDPAPPNTGPPNTGLYKQRLQWRTALDAL